MNDLRNYFNQVMHMTTKAYQLCPDQKSVIKLRQAQDKLLDNIIELTDPKTIRKLDNEAIRQFLNKKIKDKLN